MAYTEVSSNEIPEGTQYYSGKLPLGDYNFYLSIDATGVSPKIVAKCVSPDGGTRVAASRTWPAGTQVRGWNVEANETEASVYAQIQRIVGNLPQPVPTVAGGATNTNVRTKITYTESYPGAVGFITVQSESSSTHYWISKDPFVLDITETGQSQTEHYTYTPTMRTINDEPVYVYSNSAGRISDWSLQTPAVYGTATDNDLYIILYGEPESEDVLVARFAINIGNAGGYPGGDGGWTSPGDWNSDPTTTLHLTVNGALSGRHNDPLADPSYSYLPADNMAVAGYGCGGGGGHGGGGGGGASTVIAEQFATNKANSKVIVVTVKRHGYGSGGSKGAKGGDGCILIYY